MTDHIVSLTPQAREIGEQAVFAALSSLLSTMDADARMARGKTEREMLAKRAADFRMVIDRAAMVAQTVKAKAAAYHNVYSLMDARRLGADLDAKRQFAMDAADLFIDAAHRVTEAQDRRFSA